MKNPKNGQILKSSGYLKLQQLVEKAAPEVKSLDDRLNGDRSKTATPIDMRSNLGVDHCKEWIYYFDIGDLMTLDPITRKDLKKTYSLHQELTKDFLIDKVISVFVDCLTCSSAILCSN